MRTNLSIFDENIKQYFYVLQKHYIDDYDIPWGDIYLHIIDAVISFHVISMPFI